MYFLFSEKNLTLQRFNLQNNKKKNRVTHGKDAVSAKLCDQLRTSFSEQDLKRDATGLLLSL